MEGIGFKLFGKKIACPESGRIASLPVFSTATASDDGHNQQGDCDHGLRLTMGEKNCLQEERANREYSEEDKLREKKQEDESSLNLDGNPETPMADDADKALKKPDEILPCPRCNSMDTKFCYYNNYNVRQPRHFCKSCQRYWTAGGTMRNMPVGAGRRKNKITTSHYQYVTIPQEVANVSNGVRSVLPKLLSFGSDSPDIDCRNKENGDDCSSGSTVTTSNSVVEKMQEKNGFHPHVQGVSWSYNPWNSAMAIPVSPLMYPSPYWNYIPWLPLSSPTQNQMVQIDDSCILGKHSRDEELMNTNGSEEPKKQKSSVLIPKTLRIDDPDETAKTSIWLTLGIKNENIRTGGLFKAFETKAEESKKHPTITTTSPVLQANPAAFSRSLCFQERA